MNRSARALRLAIAVAVLVVVPAAPAAAHVAGGPAPSNFSGVITSIRAPMSGVQVSLSPSGDQIEIRNDSAADVLVPGYSDEPYLWIGPSGVQRNERSPATYLNATAEGTTVLPPQADPGADPDWVTLSTAPMLGWHDHRTHWMGTDLPPAVQADPTRVHLISSWEVPLSFDGEPVVISGTLTWTPPPSSLPWTVLAVALFALAVGVAGRERWRRPMLVLLVVLVTVDGLHLAISSLAGESSAFTITAGSLPTAVALLLTWASWRSVKAGTTTVAYTGGIAAWLVCIQSLSDLDVLWHSQLPSAAPGWLTRAAVTVGVGLGAGLALGCLRVLARSRGTTQAEPAAL
ncbi:MAG: hypothetical protein H0V67_10340 [Geodermatophilaceae bacterium]|nr:hypothetical protein [Geodermatophilaceae bacterium]